MNSSAVLNYAVVADGPSDRALLPIVLWSLRKHAPLGNFGPPAFRVRGSSPISSVVSEVRERYNPDIVFVHRDAERLSYLDRRVEIPQSDGVVPIIPVRMTEAWLLIDEPAIRRAAGNPNGQTPLSLPSVKRLEELPDPKATLRALLLAASELSGRRRKKFDHTAAFRRLADLIEDFSPLLGLSAFQTFCLDLVAVLKGFDWTGSPNEQIAIE